MVRDSVIFPVVYPHPKISEPTFLPETFFSCLKVKTEDKAEPAEPAPSTETNEWLLRWNTLASVSQ